MRRVSDPTATIAGKLRFARATHRGVQESFGACLRNSLESLFGKEGPARAAQRNAAESLRVSLNFPFLFPQGWGLGGLTASSKTHSRLAGQVSDLTLTETYWRSKHRRRV
jgi:hypothetical protein